MSEFLTGLLDTGSIRLRSADPASDAELVTMTEGVLTWEPTWRRSCPGIPPEPDVRILKHAIRWVHRCCQVIVYRHLDIGELESVTPTCPHPLTPGVIYSADLVLRFLPELRRHAVLRSDAEPLVVHLSRVAARWPFSSVGMPIDSTHPLNIEAIELAMAHPALRIIHTDRVIDNEAVDRLDINLVRNSVLQALGDVPVLWEGVGSTFRTALQPDRLEAASMNEDSR